MADPENTGQDNRASVVASYRPIEKLVPESWANDYVRANGVRQHYYRTGGDGRPLLLLHGFLEGALSWMRTARVLEDRYDVVMLDARAHGLSDGSEGQFSQQLLNHDVAAFVRAMGLAPCRVLGFSQGGATGIHVPPQSRSWYVR